MNNLCWSMLSPYCAIFLPDQCLWFFFKYFRVLLNKILRNSHTSRLCLCACRRLELIKKSFLLLSSLWLPLVLGYPWLQRYNPHSDWSTGVIHELGGLLPAGLSSSVIFNICSPCLQLCCVTEVSLEYHDLREVFSKANSHLCLLVIHMTVPSTACQVQPHKGTPVFIVGSYINDSLAAGLFAILFALLVLFFFFVEKKDNTL